MKISIEGDSRLSDVLKKVGMKRGERLEPADYIFLQYNGPRDEELIEKEIKEGNTFFLD